MYHSLIMFFVNEISIWCSFFSKIIIISKDDRSFIQKLISRWFTKWKFLKHARTCFHSAMFARLIFAFNFKTSTWLFMRVEERLMITNCNDRFCHAHFWQKFLLFYQIWDRFEIHAKRVQFYFMLLKLVSFSLFVFQKIERSERMLKIEICLDFFKSNSKHDLTFFIWT